MIRKFMAAAGLAVVVGAGSLVAPTAATAKSSAAEYAEAQCGNGGYAQKQYPSYEECYAFAIQYYYSQTGGPGAGGAGGHGGGGMDFGDIPVYRDGCYATRLDCNNGQ